MKVEKKQSRASVLDKAKKLAISKAVDQYAESYEKKTGKTVNAEALKSIFMLWKRWHGRRISMEM